MQFFGEQLRKKVRKKTPNFLATQLVAKWIYFETKPHFVYKMFMF